MHKYQRPNSDRDQLGKGGNCIGVERCTLGCTKRYLLLSTHNPSKLPAERCNKCRWYLTDTRDPVAAKLVDIQSCARRERNALQLAKAVKVSRVVDLIDEVADDTDKGTWLVLEYVLTCF